MTSMKPYLIRAMYEWMADNNLTPHIVVDANLEGVMVPLDYVHEGKIVLNIAMDAVRGLELGNDWISFNARFAGLAQQVHVPMRAVQIIYAKENGQGLPFPPELEPDEPAPKSVKNNLNLVEGSTNNPETKPRAKPSLRVIK
jgi:stringent starvation protein B